MTFEFEHEKLWGFFDLMKQSTSELLIEKSKIDFLYPFLYKVYAQPTKILKEPVVARFTDFDNS